MIATATHIHASDLSATHSFAQFEQAALNAGVWPSDVPSLWQKYKADAIKAAEWTMRGVFDGAVETYLLRRGDDDYFQEWLNCHEVGE